MWPRGATVARLTPDQKVACSNHVEVSRPVFCNTNFRLHGCMWKLFLPQVATWNLDHLVGPLGIFVEELSGSFPIPSIPTNLVPTYLVTVLNEKLNQATIYSAFFCFGLCIFSRLTWNTFSLIAFSFPDICFIYFCEFWIFYYEYWKENHKCQTFLSVFEVQGWQSYTDVDFYFNDICGWFLVILSRNRIHEKTLDFDFRFILCDICHFTFSWYFNDFIENCNRKMFNWRILNFFCFPRLGLIIFPQIYMEHIFHPKPLLTHFLSNIVCVIFILGIFLLNFVFKSILILVIFLLNFI